MLANKGFCEGLLDYALRHPKAGKGNLRQYQTHPQAMKQYADLGWFIETLESLRVQCRERDAGPETKP